MNMQVKILEARNLRARDSNGLSDPYVQLQLGFTKYRTTVIHMNLNPLWDEEFFFKVDDLGKELLLTLWDEDRFTDDFLGQVKIPLSVVFDADKHTLPSSWHCLQKRHKWSREPVSGELLLSLSLSGRHHKAESLVQSTQTTEASATSNSLHIQPVMTLGLHSGSEDFHLTPESSSRSGKTIAARQSFSYHPLVNGVAPQFIKGSEIFPQDGDGSVSSVGESIQTTSSSKVTDEEEYEDRLENSLFNGGDTIKVGTSGDELPAPLAGGILLDQLYAANVNTLSAILFKPQCQFYQDLFSLQKTTDVVEGLWEQSKDGTFCRVVSYVIAATKLMKAVRATEEQTLIKADTNCFVVLECVNTPDVPFGNNFRTELLFVLSSASGLLPGEAGTRLTVSWKVNFLQSTMMKSMIENGARQGLNESFQQFTELLSMHVKPIDDIPKALGMEITKSKSNWELGLEYFVNFKVVITLALLVFLLAHICMKKLNWKDGFEFWGIDLPDSFSELIVTSIVVIQVERIVNMTKHFFNARFQQDCDHGVKAVGDGWILSVTLIEGACLAPVDSTGFSDPYMVFKCSGKMRTSSVKLQTLNPQWQEIFEFGAMEDLPSTMELEVFDYEGPFAEAVSLGHAEINFLKYSSEELADIWIHLNGNLARSSGSRIHLCIFLRNTKDEDVVTQYIVKMEKEVGTKILRRSPERNSAFQKLFSLPAEEFLLDDFACSLKRKVPFQGRIFLSPRMLGFYSNLFGRKTKFSFIWEDIEEIKEVSPLRAMANLFNPSLIICLRVGRGTDSSHSARKMDSRGRLQFQFQSFVKFGTAYRMIMALWRSRALSPEQRMRIIADIETVDVKTSSVVEEGKDIETFLGLEDASMSEVYFANHPFSVKSMLALLEKKQLEKKIMEKVGFLNYKATRWESVGSRINVQQRQQSFKLCHHLCRFDSNVTCLQQKMVSEDERLCVVDEVLTLQDVPLGDNFQLQVRKEMENSPAEPSCCICRVYVGIAWHKSSMFQKRVSENICGEFTKLLIDYMDSVTKEICKTY